MLTTYTQDEVEAMSPLDRACAIVLPLAEIAGWAIGLGAVSVIALCLTGAL